VNNFRKGKDARIYSGVISRFWRIQNPAENQAFDPQKMAKPGKGFAVQEGDKLEILDGRRLLR